MDLFTGNFILLSQAIKTNWIVLDTYSTIVLEDSNHVSIRPLSASNTLTIKQIVSVNKSIVNLSIQQNIYFSQLFNPRSYSQSIVHTISLSHDPITLPNNPIKSLINLGQAVTVITAYPGLSILSLSQSVNLKTIKAISVISTIALEDGAIGFIADKRFIPNRGNYIPPNCVSVFDVNLRNFVLKPVTLTYNQNSGLYEGTNANALFVQSNGFCEWPN